MIYYFLSLKTMRNKTSAVVETLLATGNYWSEKELQAVAEKYKRMEAVLTRLRDQHSENCVAPNTYEVFFDADQALAFDPLSQPL